MSTPKDCEGTQLKVGQVVARGYRRGNSGYVERRTVARITEDGAVYLDGKYARPVNNESLLVIG